MIVLSNWRRPRLSKHHLPECIPEVPVENGVDDRVARRVCKRQPPNEYDHKRAGLQFGVVRQDLNIERPLKPLSDWVTRAHNVDGVSRRPADDKGDDDQPCDEERAPLLAHKGGRQLCAAGAGAVQVAARHLVAGGVRRVQSLGLRGIIRGAGGRSVIMLVSSLSCSMKSTRNIWNVEKLQLL